MRLVRSEEHTSELQSPCNLVCRLLLEKKKKHEEPFHTRKHCHAVRGRPTHRRTVCWSRRRWPPTQRQIHRSVSQYLFFFFFFNDTATTEIYPLSLHDALPI